MKKRTEYNRSYYAQHSEKRAAQKQESRDDFDKATSYWRQKLLFNNEMPNLIARVSAEIVKRARVDYEKVLARYEPEGVVK